MALGNPQRQVSIPFKRESVFKVTVVVAEGGMTP